MVISMGLMVCDVIASPLDAGVFDRDSTRLDALKLGPGGDALNASICMARYGLPVKLCGRVGTDAFGDMLLGSAARAGVDTGLVLRREDMTTSTSLVLLRPDGERHFAYYGRCNDTLCEADLPGSALSQARHLHVASAMALGALDGGGLACLMRRAKAHGLSTSLDLTHDSSGRWMALIEEALPYVDVFLPSANEVDQLCGLTDPEAAWAFFRPFGVKVFGVKLGAEGCYVADENGGLYLPTLARGEVADTTGAGDAFFAGFLAAWLRGDGLRDCALMGSASAACCVSALGATAGIRGFDQTRRLAITRARELGL